MSILPRFSPWSLSLEWLKYYLDFDNPTDADYSWRLNKDVLIEITTYLDFHDLLNLRLVSCRFCALTCLDVVWKRLLQHSSLTFPTLPPTTSYSLSRLSGSMCERLLRRAHSLQGGWRGKRQHAIHSWFDAFNPPHHLSILPGGRYLIVGSVEWATEKSTLVVWDLEFPQKGHATPLKRRAAIARIVIPGPVVEMKTKYMCVEGVMGIVIAFICNTPRHYKKRYWSVLHISMEALENYANAGISLNNSSHKDLYEYARNQPPPFTALAARPTSCEIESIALEVIDGSPYVALIKQNREVVLQDLATSSRAFLITDTPEADPQNWFVRAFKILPAQHQMLIIREHRSDHGHPPIFKYELYSLPEVGKRDICHPVAELHADNDFGNNNGDQQIASIMAQTMGPAAWFELSDACHRDDLHSYDASLNPIFAEKATPPTICIWSAHMGNDIDPENVFFVVRLLKPKPHIVERPRISKSGVPEVERFITYHYEELSKPSWFREMVPMCFMGGAQRTVLLLPSVTPKMDEEEEQENLPYFPARGRSRFRGQIAMLLGLTPSALEGRLDPELRLSEGVQLPLPPALRDSTRRGLVACAFDESAGRLILVAMKSSLLHVLDYADPTHVNWDQAESMELL